MGQFKLEPAETAPKRSKSQLFLLMFLDIFDHVADRQELFRLFIRHFDAELLLQRHDQLDRIERVRAEVFDELGLRCDLVRLDAELFNNDVPYALVYRFVSHKLNLALSLCHEWPNRQAPITKFFFAKTG